MNDKQKPKMKTETKRIIAKLVSGVLLTGMVATSGYAIYSDSTNTNTTDTPSIISSLIIAGCGIGGSLAYGIASDLKTQEQREKIINRPRSVECCIFTPDEINGIEDDNLENNSEENKNTL
ncbi:MAG: hypothetical protein IJ358_02020 [Clostridia bacterium]|nr:hypothetical protein [Clostridia bacterium]